jgi:hypothetical protein
MGSCTWGWGKPSCGLPSRMLGTYRTARAHNFPVAEPKIPSLARLYESRLNRQIDYHLNIVRPPLECVFPIQQPRFARNQPRKPPLVRLQQGFLS